MALLLLLLAIPESRSNKRVEVQPANTSAPQSSRTLPANPSGTINWIHIGDTHITSAGEQNALDLGNIIEEINEVYAQRGIDFVSLPGDIADAGSAIAYRFFRLNAFSEPKPDSFIVNENQRNWLEQELQSCITRNITAVLLLHCYPSDLKQGGARLVTYFGIAQFCF